MRRSVLALAVFIAFFILAGGVRAQSEYTSGVMAFRNCDGIDILNGCFDESHPFDPRVACSPDNSVCMMVIYENRSDIQSIRVKYSMGVAGKHFQNLAYGCPETGFGAWWDYVFGGCHEVTHLDMTGSGFNESVRGVYDNYHLPYDITYYNGIFYMVAHMRHLNALNSRLYSMNSTDVTYLGISECAALGTDEHNYGIGFCDDASGTYLFFERHAYPFPILYNIKGTVLGCDHGYVYAETDYLAGDAYLGTRTVLNNSCTMKTPNLTPVNESGIFRFYVDLNLSSFPTDYSGLDYYLGSSVIYQKDHNATWVTHTSDFATFTNTTVYYPWAVNESFNITDIALSNVNGLYAYELWSNDTTVDGIYIYNDVLYSFQIRARGVDVNSFTTVPISVESAISCNGGAWYYTQSGIDKTLISPCQTNNTIFITASGWQPDVVYLTGINSLNPTGITVITAPASGFGFVSSYDVKFGAFDKFASQPINGATMSVDGTTKLTASNGIATYTLYPYTVANFYISNYSNTYYLSLFGTPKVYDVFASKTGYITSDIAQVNLTGSSVPSGNSSFLRTYNIQLEPTNARLVVDVWWSDGIHYNGDTAAVRVGGNNGNIYLESGGVLYSQNYATSFPATFVMQDNRSSWTANANVTYGSYFDSTSVAVTNTVFYYFHDFYLPNSSTTHECTGDLGCGGSFCKASVWYHNGRCQVGVCVYDFDSCVLCDDEAGCYTETTNTTCPTGLDFECVGMNYCIDTKNLASYRCSASKTCFKSVEVCGYMCDSTEKVCLAAPAGVQCDQSSVTGMLGCLQSGMLSFINSVYNPFFMIMVAIFVAVMIATFFILVYKGIISVTS